MKKYTIIYADPPWFRGQRMYSSNKNDHHIEADRHYPIMKVEEICALPISKIIADDAACFMWTTDSNLDEAIQVMKSWGFKYKTIAFIWLKKEKSGKQVCFMGCWTMKQAEVVLFGTHGSMTKYLKSRKVRQLVEAPRDKKMHSKKPEEVKNLIETMFGDLPRIELFARQKTDGWDVWGNEVESDIILSGENYE
jgi:N6-adenosine-specific RNA methylase IME4